MLGPTEPTAAHHLPVYIEHRLKSIADVFLWKLEEGRLIAPFLKIGVLGSNRKLGPKLMGRDYL